MNMGRKKKGYSGSRLNMLITTNGVSSQLSWSPDGKQIVFISDDDLWIKDIPDIVVRF